MTINSAEKVFVKYKLMYNFKQQMMNLENLNVVELNAQEIQVTEGGNGIHGAGYSAAGDSAAVGEFWYGFFAALLRY